MPKELQGTALVAEFEEEVLSAPHYGFEGCPGQGRPECPLRGGAEDFCPMNLNRPDGFTGKRTLQVTGQDFDFGQLRHNLQKELSINNLPPPEPFFRDGFETVSS
jgi:hypothetical protein